MTIMTAKKLLIAFYTMFNMVHIEGAMAGLGEQQRNTGQQESNISSSTDDASVKKCRQPKMIALWTNEDGSKRPCLPRQIFWYSQNMLHPDLKDPHFHKIFHLRHWLPYKQFVELNHGQESEPSFRGRALKQLQFHCCC